MTQRPKKSFIERPLLLNQLNHPLNRHVAAKVISDTSECESVGFLNCFSQSEDLKSRDSVGRVDVEGGNVETRKGASGGDGGMSCSSRMSGVRGEIDDAVGGSCKVVSSDGWDGAVCASTDERNGSSGVDIVFVSFLVLVEGVRSHAPVDGGSKECSCSGAGVRVVIVVDSLFVSLSLLSSQRKKGPKRKVRSKRFECCHIFC